MKPFFISTAIPYVNAPGHLGHALEFIQADVIARYQRILGSKVFFLTGTDENSLKNVRAAEDLGISPKELVDKNSAKFQALKQPLNLSWDDFIRTTEERHFKGAQKLWLACKADIYKKTYAGLYCVGCEAFYEEDEIKDGRCPEHQVALERIEEENYFFKLSKYEKQLLELIESDKLRIVPASRKNEVVSFIRTGLKDICISRSAERAKGWGVQVPGDSSQIIWVWFDALPNYINALGYGEDGPRFQEFWEGEGTKLHVIGKGIIRFHAVYWSAMLLSAKLALPDTIFVHGYITVAGKKMSKSLGNVVDPFPLIEKYGADAVRYFLLREIPSAEDGDFTQEKFEERYNADLANGLGNLVARVLGLALEIKMYSPGDFVHATVQEALLKEAIEKAHKASSFAVEEFKFNDALLAIWELIAFCNQYIDQHHPWEASPNNWGGSKEKKIVGDLAATLQEIGNLLSPFLPDTAKEIVKECTLESEVRSNLFPRIWPSS
ncbi:MAG: methionine--tRNA ligase [Candidatus Wildermuthbacteria bacterium]|nr:methionine--tRNA ligase [Candidatus Wildermuthbacteria bacterium]